MKDPIVEEVRKARQDHAREFNYDLVAICCDLKRIESECGHTLVSLPPKLLTKASSGPDSLATARPPSESPLIVSG
jgi:hypothetical protein